MYQSVATVDPIELPFQLSIEIEIKLKLQLSHRLGS